MPLYSVVPAPEMLTISGDKSMFELSEQQRQLLLSTLLAAPEAAVSSQISSLFAARDGLTEAEKATLMQLLEETKADLVIHVADKGLQLMITHLGGSPPPVNATWPELLCKIYQLLGGTAPCQDSVADLFEQIGGVI